MILHWLLCIQYQYVLSTCDGAYLEVVFDFERRATYFCSVRAKFVLAPHGMP